MKQLKDLLSESLNEARNHTGVRASIEKAMHNNNNVFYKVIFNDKNKLQGYIIAKNPNFSSKSLREAMLKSRPAWVTDVTQLSMSSAQDEWDFCLQTKQSDYYPHCYEIGIIYDMDEPTEGYLFIMLETGKEEQQFLDWLEDTQTFITIIH